jgi:hypothetical protein
VYVRDIEDEDQGDHMGDDIPDDGGGEDHEECLSESESEEESDTGVGDSYIHKQIRYLL